MRNRADISLKSKLLVGAVGLTAATASSGAAADPAATPASAPPKWLPYAEIGGGLGSGYTVGNVDVFAPLWQNLNSLLFVQVDAGTEGRSNVLYSAGAGFRTKINRDWILGVYGNYDSTETTFDHTFKQVSAGAELMSQNWDLRVNGYLADNGFQTIKNKYDLYIHDTQIAILQGQEAGYSGFDGEVGYRVFDTQHTDMRLFAGGFMFSHGDADNVSLGQKFDFAYRTMAGPKARAEVNIFDLDFIGLQSRFSLEGEVAHDEVRGTTGFVGATLRIPLNVGGSSAGAQALDEIDRRMVDPERRQDNVLTHWEYSKPEPVVVYGSHFRSQPTNTIYYVDNTLGAGSYANPTTLNDATSRTSTNAFIVITSKQGVNDADAVMQAGQSIVGGGETFGVIGTKSGKVFSHDFAPNTTDPTVEPASAGANVITVADTTWLYGFAITGDFGDGVYGHNVNNVKIGNLTIDGTGAGNYGIAIYENAPGTSNIYIGHTSVSNVTGSGIQVYTSLAITGTLTESDMLQTDTVTDAGQDGIKIFSFAGNASGAVVSQYAGIHDSTVTNATVDDILIKAVAGPGGTVTQNFVVDPTSTTGGEYGLALEAKAYGAGAMTGQYGTVSDFTSTGASDDGVKLGVKALTDGDVNQTITLNDITATGATSHSAGYGNGFILTGYVASGGFIDQKVTLDGLTATGNYSEGLVVFDKATGGTVNVKLYATDVTASGNTHLGVGVYGYTSGGAVTQGVYLSNLTSSNNGHDGVEIEGRSAGGTTTQTFETSDATAESNMNDGLKVDGYAHASGTVNQYLDVYGASNLFDGNKNDGLEFDVKASGVGATAIQKLNVDDSDVSNNETGASFDASAYKFGQVTQTGYFDATDALKNASDGIDVNAFATTVGSIQQSFKLSGTAAQNGQDGVFIKTDAVSGGTITQTANLIDNSDFNANADDGIDISTTTGGSYVGHSSTYYSHVTQTVTVASPDVVEDGRYGVNIFAHADSGAQVEQQVTLTNPDIEQSGKSGIYWEVNTNNAATALTAVYSDLYVTGGTINGNTGFGIEMKSIADTGTHIGERLYVTGGAQVNHNGRDGLYDSAVATGQLSYNGSYIKLSGAEFYYNAGDGAHFKALQNTGLGGSTITHQDIEIVHSDFGKNGGDGLHLYADAYGAGGTVEQNASISYSNFVYNTNDGIFIYRRAHNGTYVAGHPCTGVQGTAGGCAVIEQTIDIDNSALNHNTNDGIYLETTERNYGAVYAASGRPAKTPSLQMNDTSASYNGADGLTFINKVYGSSDLYQYIKFQGVADQNTDLGLVSGTNVKSGSTALQAIILYGYRNQISQVERNGKDGVYIASYAVGAGSLVERLLVNYVDVENNGDDGVHMHLTGNKTFLAEQYLSLTSSTISGNGTTGTYGGVYVRQDGSHDHQSLEYVTTKDNTIASNGDYGIFVLQNDTSSHFAIQNVSATYDTFTGNGRGIGQQQRISGTNYGFQTSLIGHENITGGARAIYVLLAADHTYASGKNYVDTTTQDIEFNKLTGITLGGGIYVQVEANDFGIVNTSTFIGQNQIKGADGDGISVELEADGGKLNPDYTHSKYAAQVTGNYVLNTSGYGIRVDVQGTHDSSIGQYARAGKSHYFATTIAGNTVTNAGDSGIAVVDYINGFSTVENYIGTFGKNVVTNANLDGISVTSSSVSGSILSVTNDVEHNYVYHSGRAGIYNANFSTNAGLDAATYVGNNRVTYSGSGSGLHKYAGIEIADDNGGSSSEYINDSAHLYNNVSIHNTGAGVYFDSFGDGNTNQNGYSRNNASGFNLYGIEGRDSNASNQSLEVYVLHNNVYSDGTAYSFTNTGSGSQNVF